MAKKYLLYIHDPLFEMETNKSQLINNLLERHYHDTVGGQTQEQIKQKLEKQIERVTAPPAETHTDFLSKPRPIRTKTDAVKVTAGAKRYCTHGAAPGFCKFIKCPNHG